LAHVLQTLSDLDLDEDEDKGEKPTTSKMSNEWFPYDLKLSFLLDAVDNLPRLQIPGSLMRVFLWLLREVGVKKVPSFDALCKAQKKL
jgi:hypothetical protein